MMVSAVNNTRSQDPLSKLLKRVRLGEEIVIAKAGKPIARLVPFKFNQMRSTRKPGSAKGILSIGAQFDEPFAPGI
jgi:antitoxin (DNA-binding transcriptional repressor) of toxin-antitoxin stability system